MRANKKTKRNNMQVYTTHTKTSSPTCHNKLHILSRRSAFLLLSLSTCMCGWVPSLSLSLYPVFFCILRVMADTHFSVVSSLFATYSLSVFQLAVSTCLWHFFFLKFPLVSLCTCHVAISLTRLYISPLRFFLSVAPRFYLYPYLHSTCLVRRAGCATSIGKQSLWHRTNRSGVVREVAPDVSG